MGFDKVSNSECLHLHQKRVVFAKIQRHSMFVPNLKHLKSVLYIKFKVRLNESLQAEDAEDSLGEVEKEIISLKKQTIKKQIRQ